MGTFIQHRGSLYTSGYTRKPQTEVNVKAAGLAQCDAIYCNSCEIPQQIRHNSRSNWMKQTKLWKPCYQKNYIAKVHGKEMLDSKLNFPKHCHCKNFIFLNMQHQSDLQQSNPPVGNPVQSRPHMWAKIWVDKPATDTSISFSGCFCPKWRTAQVDTDAYLCIYKVYLNHSQSRNSSITQTFDV